MSSNYTIVDGHDQWLGSAQEHDVRRVAQELANERGETVYFFERGEDQDDEPEAVEPERRPLLEWVQNVREDLRLHIIRVPEQNVVLVSDGQFRWAGDLDRFERAAAEEVVYGEVLGDPIPARAYSDLCSAVPALDPADPRVVAACEAQGWDADVLQF